MSEQAIPRDIRTAAEQALRFANCSSHYSRDAALKDVAAAILAERRRCAEIAFCDVFDMLDAKQARAVERRILSGKSEA